MASPLGFFFLLLTTSQLIVRLGAFHPALGPIPFFQIFIIPCVLFSLPGVLHQLSGDSLSRNPISLYMLAFTGWFLVSALLTLGPDEGFPLWFDFLKAVVFYFLVLANVQSRKRITLFSSCYILFVIFSACVAMANYYNYLDMEGYSQLKEFVGYDATGMSVWNQRLSGPMGTSSGDPNDFCLMMLPAIFLSAYFGLASRGLLQKSLALISVVTLVRSMMLTQSRGGMLGLLSGLAFIVWTRYGLKRTLPFVLVVIPALIAVQGGRQMDFTTKSGTGQTRVQIWSVGIEIIKTFPILGVGPGHIQDYTSHVAHNSFIQAFTELGLPGGTLFMGILFSAGWMLYKLVPHWNQAVDPELWPLRPVLIGILVGSAVSMSALTRTYAVETFIVVGLLSAYYYCVTDQYYDTPIRSNLRFFLRVVLVSAGYLLTIRFHVLTST